jgi:hypothetical protein
LNICYLKKGNWSIGHTGDKILQRREEVVQSNEVAPPPVCFEELPKLKAKLAGIRDEDRENVVRNWALSIAASLGIC